MSVAIQPPAILTAAQAAEYIGVRPQTLATWRMTGANGLVFVKVGRAVRYRVDDLDAWLAARSGTNSRAILKASRSN